MKITNITGLPDAIVNYRDHVENTKYSSGGADFSVTTLIDSPRIKLLTAMHNHEMKRDASQDIFAMLGTAMHHIIETGASFEHTAEERLFVKVNGKTVSGQIDLQELRDDGSVDITDFKVTSVWAEIIDKMQKPDWIAQQNMYAELVEQAKGVRVNSISVCCLFRDWSKAESRRRNDYPEAPIMRTKLPLWSKKERRTYLNSRVKAHTEAQEMQRDDAGLPLCSDTDRWARKGKFAVMKEGRKSALKLLDTKEEADEWAQKAGYWTNITSLGYGRLKKGFSIDERPAKYVRCDDWCQVSKWCSQLKAEKLLNAMGNNKKEAEI